MIKISSLAKVSGVILNNWFVPTMFKALELDNTFVLWSSLESEYFIDTVNNSLKLKYFNRRRASFPINVKIEDGKVLLIRNRAGDYYPSRDEVQGFRLPLVGDSLILKGITYLISDVSQGDMNIELTIANKANFISNFTGQVSFMDGSIVVPLYTDTEGTFYAKYYRSQNVADAYIDGEDIRSIVGAYM